MRAWLLTTLATLALLTTLVHRQALAAVAATVTHALALSDVQYGWLSTGMAASFLVGSLSAARFTQRLGPQMTLTLTVAATSLVIGLHALATGFFVLLLLRIGMGFAVSSSMPAATQTIHRVLPFKDRARGIALLYMGNSLGSALCAPLAVTLEARIGWRWTFFCVAILGLLWVAIWSVASNFGQARGAVNSLGPTPDPMGADHRIGVFALARYPGVLRGSLLVAAAAPVTLIMLIWSAKFLVHDYAVSQRTLGQYLWLPASMFGAGSLLFGEMRSRSAKKRANARPPRQLVGGATLLCLAISLVPAARSAGFAVILASVAMAGAGGLYTLATSDMLAHIPRQAVAATAGLTTVTQSLVYIVASPIIGKVVEHFGNYTRVMVGAGLWVLPCALIWLIEASVRSESTRSQRP